MSAIYKSTIASSNCKIFFFFNDTATTEIYTLSLHDALPISGSVPVAIVNETFMKKYLSNVDPLTERIVVEQLIPGATRLGPAIEWRIVGVYHDVHNAGVRREGFPEIDVPFWQSPWPLAGIAPLTRGDPLSMTKSIAAVVQSMDSDLPLDQVRTMDQLVDESLAGDRFSTVLF